MNKLLGLSLAAAAALAATAAQADTLAYNSGPSDGWIFGNGNGYVPPYTAVLTTDAGAELYMRVHQTYFGAPASTGAGVYSLALGTTNVSFDWGVDNNAIGFDNVAVNFSLTNLGTSATGVWAGMAPGNDNEFSAGGSMQNSARLAWVPGLGFDANVNNTYAIQMNVTGLEGGDKSLTVYAQLGSGAVPEPATWGMMILGLGAVGGALRTRKRTAVSFA